MEGGGHPGTSHSCLANKLIIIATCMNRIGLLLPCYSQSSSELAAYGKWECGDGYCIPLAYKCDGYYDCLRGNDELNCGKLKYFLTDINFVATLESPHSKSFAVICRGESFSCMGSTSQICVSKHSYCDGIRDCTDGSDEPDACLLSTLSSLNKFFSDFKKVFSSVYDIANPKNTYGPIFGGIVGIIVLFFTILILVAVVMTLCVCNKHCPIYKWRQRRGQPPVGVMIAADNREPEEGSVLYNIGINTNFVMLKINISIFSATD